MPRAEIRTRVAEALSLVGLEDYADRRPAQLSGGQQQRVALARTIVVRPKVLLLDEPLSNLDAKMREQVRRELRDLQQKLRLTTVFVTHDQEEANTTCDRVAVLKDGRVQQVGTPIDLYNRPANLFVANFLGTINSLEGKATADGLFAGPQGLRVPLPSGLASGNSLRAIFRPQSAEIQPSTAAAPAAGSADRAFLPATVQRQEFLGAILRYGVQAGDAAIVIDAPYHAGVPLHPVGSQVTVMVPHAAVQFLPA